MRIIRIYTGEDQQSHFEELDIPLMAVAAGQESSLIPTAGLLFRENHVGVADFHPAPRRQFVVTISGVGELECGDGTRRRFGAGDVLLADDLTGQGHITREIQGPRRMIFIPLPRDLDLTAWRTGRSG